MPTESIFGTLLALGIQDVERVAQVGEELLAGIEALRRREPHVVGVERVRNDEVRTGDAVRGGDHGPERQVVAVVIGIVQKAAVLDDEAPRVRAVATGVPADRRVRRWSRRTASTPNRMCSRSVASSTFW